MPNDKYTKDRTALLFIDLYNDFLSEGGKLWPMVEGVALKVGARIEWPNLRTRDFNDG